MRTSTEILAELRPLEEQVHKLAKELQRALDKESKTTLDEVFKDGITIEGIMSLNWLDVRDAWHKRITSWFYNEADMPGTYQSGYIVSTRQASVQIKLDQNLPLDKQRGIEKVIPHLKEVDGWKIVSIFEHTLSASGSWYLVINEAEGKYVVTTHRNLWEGRVRSPDERAPYDWTEMSSLDEALQHIYGRHPYERKGGGGEDDYYDAGFGRG